MIEIEFKAKRLHINEWVFGSLYVRTVDNIVKYYIIENVNRPWRRVTPETVCQWTGLFDKNKTKLYDGDKFQYRKHDGYFLDDFVGVVKYKNGSFGFTVIGEASTGYFVPFSKFDELHEDFLNHIEIIGNIHDKAHQKQALINMIRCDEELGLYDEEK